MSAALQDLDNISTALRCEVAADIAARRALWCDLTPRQRRKLARAAVREFCEWLQEQPNTRTTGTTWTRQF